MAAPDAEEISDGIFLLKPQHLGCQRQLTSAFRETVIYRKDSFPKIKYCLPCNKVKDFQEHCFTRYKQNPEKITPSIIELIKDSQTKDSFWFVVIFN